MKHHSAAPAQATVDFVAKAIGGGESYWRVRVATAPGWPAPKRAVYTIKAFSDSLAAIEGLRRFEEETASPPQPLVS
jgi:hypothetical protein